MKDKAVCIGKERQSGEGHCQVYIIESLDIATTTTITITTTTITSQVGRRYAGHAGLGS